MAFRLALQHLQLALDGTRKLPLTALICFVALTTSLPLKPLSHLLVSLEDIQGVLLVVLFCRLNLISHCLEHILDELPALCLLGVRGALKDLLGPRATTLRSTL